MGKIMLKSKRVFCLFFVMVFTMCFFTACGTSDKTQPEYWFKNYKSEYIAFDEDNYEESLEEAGRYWEFESKKDYGKVIISLRVGGLDMFSSVHLYVNGVEKTPDAGVISTYDYSYCFDFKKGDKVKIHAKWDNGAVAGDKEQFSMALFGFYLQSDKKDYIITMQ